MLFCTWGTHAQVFNDTILFEDGSLYTGQLSDSVFNGNGKMIYSDNTIYNGEWKNGMWDGKGELHFPDGDFYQGTNSTGTVFTTTAMGPVMKDTGKTESLTEPVQ